MAVVKKLRSLTLLLLCLLLLPVLSQASSRPLVVDNADLFTSAEVQAIEQAAQSIIDAYQVDVVVVTSSAVPYEDTADYADRYFEDHGYGIGEDRAGILYLIDMRNRQYYFSTAGVMIDYITDSREEDLLDAAESDMRRGAYGQSALAFLSKLTEFMDEGRVEGSFRYDEVTGERLTGLYNKLTDDELGFSLFAGLLTAVVFVLIVASRYSLRGSTYHYNQSSVRADLTQDTSQPIRSTVRRVPRVQNNGGGSGGGGGGFGSGTHVSSGGMSHGGGGRGF